MLDLPADRGVQRAPDRPLLAPWWRVVQDGERILFEHAGKVVELRGRAVRALLPALLPLLDGAHTHAEIDAELGEAAGPSVRNALALLADHGLLTDGPAVSDDGTSGFVASIAAATTPAAAREALAAADVRVLGSSALADECARVLEASAVNVGRTGWDEPPPADVSLVVAAPRADEAGRLADTNEARLGDRVPWLPVLPYDGRQTTVGPLTLPRVTACHHCLRLRRGATSGYEEDHGLVELHPVAARAPRAVDAVAAGLAALIALRWLAVRDPTLPGVAYAFEGTAIPTLTRHRVLRVPRCPSCGASGPPPNPWFKEADAGDPRRAVHAGR